MLINSYRFAAATGDPYYSYVELLLKGEGVNGSTTFTDLSPSPKTITRVQAFSYLTTNSNEQSKFGSGSIKYNYSAGSYLATAIGPINIRTTPFTIESWFYRTSTTGMSGAFMRSASGNDFYCMQASGGWYLGDGVTNNIIVSDSTFAKAAVNAWTHLCVSFDGAIYRMFINGTQEGSSTSLLKSFNLTDVFIAAYGGTGTAVAYLDEVRITRYSRYTVGTGASAGKMVLTGTNTLGLQTATFPESG